MGYISQNINYFIIFIDIISLWARIGLSILLINSFRFINEIIFINEPAPASPYYSGNELSDKFVLATKFTEFWTLYVLTKDANINARKNFVELELQYYFNLFNFYLHFYFNQLNLY